MRHLLVLSCALLAGCAPTQHEYTIIRETTLPTEQATPAVPSPAPVADTCPLAQKQQMPSYYAGTYTAPVSNYQTEQQITSQYTIPGKGHVICGHNMQQQLGGNVMNLQQGQMTTQAFQQQPMSQMVQQPQPIMQQPVQVQPMTLSESAYTTIQMPAQFVMAPATTEMMQTATMAMPVQQEIQQTATYTAQNVAQNYMTADVVILQHPTNRDLVKCTLGDTVCVMNYEAQGYVQLQNSSAPAMQTYNADTSIPRW